MHAGADLQAERADAVANALGAGDGPSRAVEQGQRAIAGGVHQLALIAVQLASHQLKEVVEQVAEPAIADLRRQLRRPDYINEQHGAKEPVPGPAASPWRRE